MPSVPRLYILCLSNHEPGQPKQRALSLVERQLRRRLPDTTHFSICTSIKRLDEGDACRLLQAALVPPLDRIRGRAQGEPAGETALNR